MSFLSRLFALDNNADLYTEDTPAVEPPTVAIVVQTVTRDTMLPVIRNHQFVGPYYFDITDDQDLYVLEADNHANVAYFPQGAYTFVKSYTESEWAELNDISIDKAAN